MRKSLMLVAVAGLIASFAGLPSASAQNLLLNGDLDSPGPGATIDNWSKDEFKTFSGDTTDLITLEPWIEIAPITNGGGDNDLGGFLKAFQGNGSTGDLATLHLYQDVAGSEGLEYGLSGWLGAGANYSGLLTGDPRGDTKTELAIEFDNDNDRDNGWISDAILDVKAAGLTSGAFPDFGAQQFSVSGVAPAGTTIVRARVSMIDAYNTTNPDPALFIDDFSLQVIPEPSSVILGVLGMLGVGWAARRRK